MGRKTDDNPSPLGRTVKRQANQKSSSGEITGKNGRRMSRADGRHHLDRETNPKNWAQPANDKERQREKKGEKNAKDARETNERRQTETKRDKGRQRPRGETKA